MREYEEEEGVCGGMEDCGMVRGGEKNPLTKKNRLVQATTWFRLVCES